ncbi:MAG: hypothetical protein AAGC64_06665 [Bacteroidota bacterium]
MSEIEEYDQFIVGLQNKIYENPDMKYKVLLQGIIDSGCPYLKDKVKSILGK